MELDEMAEAAVAAAREVIGGPREHYGDAWFWRPMADLWAFAAQAVDERDGIGPRDLDRWADDGGRSA